MNKPSLVLIDHGYRKLTKSTVFLDKILENDFKIKRLYDDSYLGLNEPSVEEINSFSPEAVIYFGTTNTPYELKKISCKNIVWIPMFDNVLGNSIFDWLSYHGLNIKFLNFSKTLNSKLHLLGFNTKYVQYFLEPNLQQHEIKSQNSSKKINFFFWNRTRKITWQTVRELVPKEKNGKIIFRNFPDPNQPAILPSQSEIEEYNIEIINGWLDKSKYAKILSSCDAFISPRLFEGMGESFITALSLGLCVVAANNPTMNEYVKNNLNGYLFNPTNPQKINFDNFNYVRENSIRSARDGFAAWSKEKKSLIEFVMP